MNYYPPDDNNDQPRQKKTNGWRVLLILIIAAVALFICGIVGAHSGTPVTSSDATADATNANATVSTKESQITAAPQPADQ